MLGNPFPGCRQEERVGGIVQSGDQFGRHAGRLDEGRCPTGTGHAIREILHKSVDCLRVRDDLAVDIETLQPGFQFVDKLLRVDLDGSGRRGSPRPAESIATASPSFSQLADGSLSCMSVDRIDEFVMSATSRT